MENYKKINKLMTLGEALGLHMPRFRRFGLARARDFGPT